MAIRTHSNRLFFNYQFADKEYDQIDTIFIIPHRLKKHKLWTTWNKTQRVAFITLTGLDNVTQREDVALEHQISLQLGLTKQIVDQ